MTQLCGAPHSWGRSTCLFSEDKEIEAITSGFSWSWDLEVPAGWICAWAFGFDRVSPAEDDTGPPHDTGDVAWDYEAHCLADMAPIELVAGDYMSVELVLMCEVGWVNLAG